MSAHAGFLLEKFCETLRMIYLGCFLLLCGLTHVMASYPIWWSLAVGHQYSSLGTQPILCGSIPGLVPKQLRFCRNYVEIMPSVAEGVKIGIQECQHQFRGRRWNCTTVNDNLAIFGPVLDKGNVTKQTVNCNKMSRLCTSLFFVQIRVYLNTQHKVAWCFHCAPSLGFT
ncbi:Protein Wnt-3a [Larimichthys crocea]|uniref:Uncharacterized protein n=1 Tax=Larimichthys crocea TaxID=215358 RepID=A0ACD3QQQ8_LARCR|nr:Protein Wnt-3a [Larimichthys crocea]